MSAGAMPSTAADASPGSTLMRKPPWSQRSRGSASCTGQLLEKVGLKPPFSVFTTGKPESGEKVAGAKGLRAKYQAMSPEPDSSLVPIIIRQLAFRGAPRSFTAFMASREATTGPLSSSVPRP